VKVSKGNLAWAVFTLVWITLAGVALTNAVNDINTPTHQMRRIHVEAPAAGQVVR